MTQFATGQVKQVTKGDAQMQSEYTAYLMRAALTGALAAGQFLTYEQFCTVMGRWNREYHSAWMANNRVLMQELEGKLML